MDSPVMADFAASLERISALTERSAGFVWRLQTDEGDATSRVQQRRPGGRQRGP